jgi:hypothetical protein
MVKSEEEPLLKPSFTFTAKNDQTSLITVEESVLSSCPLPVPISEGVVIKKKSVAKKPNPYARVPVSKKSDTLLNESDLFILSDLSESPVPT